MKSIYKGISGLVLAGCLILLLAAPAAAQRGRGGFRGGVHVGFGGPRFGFGFGGPAFGFGIGAYRPYYAYPRVGFYINTLPYGYYPFFWGDDQYYYYGGTFYRPYNNGYEIAAPPVGAAIPELPKNAHPIMIDGQQYYELNGVYYKEEVDDKGKKVFIISGKDGVLNTDAAQQQAPKAPQVGDVVNQLPDGCRKVTLNGKHYFVSADDVYYEEMDSTNGQAVTYRVASVPEDDAPEPVKQ